MDIQFRCNLVLNEWISANKRLVICNNKLLLKRIFYYIQYVEDELHEENMKITANGLGKFNKGEFNESFKYNRFREKLRKHKEIISSRYIRYR